jgi:hypothetical protein
MYQVIQDYTQNFVQDYRENLSTHDKFHLTICLLNFRILHLYLFDLFEKIKGCL